MIGEWFRRSKRKAHSQGAGVFMVRLSLLFGRGGASSLARN